MAKQIFTQLWGDQKNSVLRACQMIEAAAKQTRTAEKTEHDNLQRKLNAVKKRKLNYSRMRADEELTADEYKELSREIESEIANLQSTIDQADDNSALSKTSINYTAIQIALEQTVDLKDAKIPDYLIDEFVETITPTEDYRYRWKMNFGPRKNKAERTDLVNPPCKPLVSIHIDYETAKQWRLEFGLPTQQFRRCTWNDLDVDVYI